MKILIADDFPLFTQKLIQKLDNQANIVVAKNGKVALEEYHYAHKADNPFDLILLDLNMPIMGGEDFLTCVRTYEDGLIIPKTKIIIISAEKSTEKIMELFKKGCDYYLKKPFLKKDLDKAIYFIYKLSNTK
jgi:CheY-like chemotaxis protein